MTETENKALYIAEQCRKAGMTLAGAAGVLINFEAESLISETNVEDRYHRDTGGTDADYTRMVDSNPSYDFISDNGKHYGYGLAQWTLESRKKEMREFHKARGVSIGDFRTQVDFFILECRRDFPSVWNILCTSNDPGQCAWQVCRWFENPYNAEGQANNRSANVGKWYNFLLAHAGEESSIPVEPEPTPSQPAQSVINPISAIQTGKIKLRTIDQGIDGWPEVWLLQAALKLRGSNVTSDGMFGSSLTEKVKQFQKLVFPNDPSQWDGVVGPLTWAALLAFL